MSFYLKYRPRSFDELIGQRHITDVVTAQLDKEKFSHTYLLYGPRGTGKTTTARLIAKAVNGLTGETAEKLDKGQYIDYVEIDAASHTGVENIREEIIDKALYPPTELNKKVYVIDEVHMLSKGAFNALLKIMEEPPEYLMFILATTEIHKVPDTIVSRSQVFNFKRLTVDDMVERLKMIADKEDITYDEEALILIAKMANGGVRDAIKYLEQIGMLGKVTVKTVSTFLWVVSEQVITAFLDAIKAGDFGAVVKQLNEIEQQGADMAQLAKDCIRYVDEHFMDDPGRYAKLAETFKDIVIWVKSYPHPIIIYKMHLWTLMNDGESSPQQATQTTPQKSAESQPQKTEPKEQPKKETEKQPQKDQPQEEQSQEEDIAQEEPEGSDLPDEESKEVAVTPEASSEHEELMEKLVGSVDKMMVKSILKKSAIIDGIEDDRLSLIVINEQYYNTLKKPDIIKYLEEILLDVRWEKTKLQLTYMNKEAYLQKQLSG